MALKYLDEQNIKICFDAAKNDPNSMVYIEDKNVRNIIKKMLN
jgi:hypothetical protein